MSIDNVADLNPRVQYVAAVAQVAFSYGFPIFVAADLVVDVNGVTKALTTDYTVSGAGADTGGTVTFLVAPGSGKIVTIYRDISIARTSDFQPNGPLASATLNDELDKLTLILQQQESLIGRAIRMGPTDQGADADQVLPDVPARAGKFLAFDVNGVRTMSVGTGTDAALRTDLAATTSGADGSRLTGYRRTSTGSVGASVWAYLNRTIHVEDFGANTTPGTTDMTAVIQAAIDAAAALGGGTVVLPGARMRITSALAMKAKVNIVGHGYISVIEAADVDALTFSFTTGFGKVVLRDFAILGTSGTTRRAIFQAGTLNDADELYGITLSRLLITDFNVCIKFRNVRVCTIEDCWLQDTNIGLDLTGKCFNFRIRGNEIILGDGNGAGDRTGILLENFNFSGGTGFVGPEGIVIDGNNHIFGFDRCIKAVTANVVYIANNDLSGRVHGIEFTTVQNGFSIVDTFIEMSGAGSLAAIKGNGLGSQIAANINIERVSILGSTTTTCVGVQINDAGNSLQNHVNVVRCLIEGMTSYDILMNNPGQANIENNRCKSTGVTEAIKIGPRQSGVITVTKNHCLGGIEVEVADAKAGTVRVYDNIDDGTNTLHAEAIGWYEEGTWTPADASGAALVLVGPVGTYTKNGNMVTARCQFTYPATADASLNVLSGLPYNLPAAGESFRQGNVSYTDVGTAAFARPSLNSNQFILRNPTGGQYTNVQLSGVTFTLEITYAMA